MKTRFMHYERLQSLSPDNHVRFGKEVELDEGDDEEAAFDRLRADINEKLGLEAKSASLQAEIEQLQKKRDQLVAKINVRSTELARIRDDIAVADDSLTSCQGNGQ